MYCVIDTSRTKVWWKIRKDHLQNDEMLQILIYFRQRKRSSITTPTPKEEFRKRVFSSDSVHADRNRARSMDMEQGILRLILIIKFLFILKKQHIYIFMFFFKKKVPKLNKMQVEWAKIIKFSHQLQDLELRLILKFID